MEVIYTQSFIWLAAEFSVTPSIRWWINEHYVFFNSVEIYIIGAVKKMCLYFTCPRVVGIANPFIISQFFLLVPCLGVYPRTTCLGKREDWNPACTPLLAFTHDPSVPMGLKQVPLVILNILPHLFPSTGWFLSAHPFPLHSVNVIRPFCNSLLRLKGQQAYCMIFKRLIMSG